MPSRSSNLSPSRWLALSLIVGVTCPTRLQAESPLSPLERLKPATALMVRDISVEAWQTASRHVDQWIADRAWDPPVHPEAVLPWLMELVDVKEEHDRLIDDLFELRGEFARLASDQQPRLAARNYLQVLSISVDLGGRLRYALRDAIENGAYILDPAPPLLDQLVERLTERRVGAAAGALSHLLVDPQPSDEASPFPDETKRRVLRLIEVSGDAGLIGELADFLRQTDVPPSLVLRAAIAVRELGLPQEPLANTDEDDRPAIVPSDLQAILAAIDGAGLAVAEREQLRSLRADVRERARVGLAEPRMRLGSCEVRPGDWLLMRNPSPYNRFTDLAPGLFTHVGVVTERIDAEGHRRLVIVDLPERGTRVPATNVDAFLERSLHYVFLRHPDAAVARSMADAAASIIGNECQFDLAFQTSRLEEYRGRDLHGQRIHTYCAGLLVLVAQAANQPRTDVFPFVEYAPSEQSRVNLEAIGLSIGDNFVSPTGPIFSPRLAIVGRREPMYDPGREVKEIVYDQFALSIAERRLVLAPDLLQSMRLETARLTKSHPWLASTLARLNNVSPDLDLEAAAKAASVIEGLDQIADRSWHRFEAARDAIRAEPEDLDWLQANDPEAFKEAMALRRTHSALVARWLNGRLTPRELRVALIEQYAGEACRELDTRYFRPAAAK